MANHNFPHCYSILLGIYTSFSEDELRPRQVALVDIAMAATTLTTPLNDEDGGVFNQETPGGGDVLFILPRDHLGWVHNVSISDDD